MLLRVRAATGEWRLLDPEDLDPIDVAWLLENCDSAPIDGYVCVDVEARCVQ